MEKHAVTAHVPWRPGSAVIVAIGLLLTSGAAYRMAAARLTRPVDSAPIPPGTLARLPMEMGEWIGRETPFDERIVKATDTDECLNRVYARRLQNENVGFFIGYGVRLRDLAPHRPEVCYPGVGWTLDERVEAEISAVDGTTLPCQIHHFRRGGLVREHITVLNYYIVDGQYCADVSLLRSKAWKANTDQHYAAQVQITCGDPTNRPEALESVRAFAAVSAPVIRALLVEALNESVAASHADPEEEQD
ncbi:MAG: EpsI family protein [Phycisphaerae bacterium]|nr:EpsI family protein [Phycisphaerae bacterium]